MDTDESDFYGWYLQLSSHISIASIEIGKQGLNFSDRTIQAMMTPLHISYSG
jgi:hypothetical protein